MIQNSSLLYDDKRIELIANPKRWPPQSTPINTSSLKDKINIKIAKMNVIQKEFIWLQEAES